MTTEDGEDGAGQTVLEALAAALRAAAARNSDAEVAPVAVLWPDPERWFAPLVPLLRDRMGLPVLTLGDYRPDEDTGPAIWLRWRLDAAFDVSDGTPVDHDPTGAASTPVVYLPGHGRGALRSTGSCPPELRPLVPIQYAGTTWVQSGGRDWTVPAFLSARLGADVARGDAVREALLRARVPLADVTAAVLRQQESLGAAFFRELVMPDPAGWLLRWLGDPDATRRATDDDTWEALRGTLRADYGFDPVSDGPLAAGQRLALRQGPWSVVWQRFADAPRKHPGIVDLLTRAYAAPAPVAAPAPRPQLGLPGVAPPPSRKAVRKWTVPSGAWPQDSQEAEDRLRSDLALMVSGSTAEVRARLPALAGLHADRRHWVWAELGRAPLAEAIVHLAELARLTSRPPGGPTVAAVTGAYTEWGWGADDAALRALAAVSTQADLDAVAGVVAGVYGPWLAEAAGALQVAWVREAPEPEGPPVPADAEVGTCVLFADGLRYDLGQRLAADLRAGGAAVEESARMAALPNLTPTAKPAVAPVVAALVGGSGMAPAIAATGTALAKAGLDRLLGDLGWQSLAAGDTGDPSGRAWTEAGQIDAYGHNHRLALARHVGGEVERVAERVRGLLAAGWRRVVVVTDHGWLLLPGGLPKVDLPLALTEGRKGRCARLKPGAPFDGPTVAWRWNPGVRFAMAPGTAAFEDGVIYDHGGLSPQECVTPVLTVTVAVRSVTATIGAVNWSGLRCRAMVEGGGSGLSIDLRRKAGDPSTSLAAPRLVAAAGPTSLVVEDDDRLGEPAHLVVLGPDGVILAQSLVTVGGE